MLGNSLEIMSIASTTVHSSEGFTGGGKQPTNEQPLAIETQTKLDCLLTIGETVYLHSIKTSLAEREPYAALYELKIMEGKKSVNPTLKIMKRESHQMYTLKLSKGPFYLDLSSALGDLDDRDTVKHLKNLQQTSSFFKAHFLVRMRIRTATRGLS